MNHHGKDLVLLVADLDAENSLRGILGRWQALGIRQLTEGRDYDVHRHPERDPGCRGDAHNFLQGFVNTHRHALVVFDHDGCGWEGRTAAEIETDVENRLGAAGWRGRCATIVIEPELEAWVWSDSPHVDLQLGWQGRSPRLREWLVSRQLIGSGEAKPTDPKTAMRQAMRQAGKPPSPRVFSALAESVGLARCQDRAFGRLRQTLAQWFGQSNALPQMTTPGEPHE